MSSRAVRKLHGDSDLALLAPVDDDKESDISEDDGPAQPIKTKANLFELLGDDEGIVDDDIEEEEEKEDKKEDTEPKSTGAVKKKRKKKKKKKANEKKEQRNEENNVDENPEDEIDASIREVNKILGPLPVTNGIMNTEEVPVSIGTRSLLSIEHKHLNPDNEMRRIFGSQVVRSEHRRKERRKNIQKSGWLVSPRPNWPPISKTGLSMTLGSSKNGYQYFNFEHSKEYQKVEFQFLDAVESYNPSNLISLVNMHPYHINSLLQLSEVCKMSEDLQMATELIEKALYCMEGSLHTLFNLAQGTCRLDYRHPENRALFLALFRHLVYIGNKGSYRTALELCKLLLGLDPNGDPICILLMMDFYAIRSEQYDYLIRLYNEWESHKNLSQLPNFAFSTALAHFHSNEDGGKKADSMLQEALIMFPSVLIGLLDKCSIQPDPLVASHPFFSASSHTSQPVALTQLVSLFIARNFSSWKQPEVMGWLERNVQEVLKRVDNKDPLVQSFRKKRLSRYQKAPRNVYRHLIMSEIKEALIGLPVELSNTPILSYDPLPPLDSIVSYTRPARQSRVQHDQSGALASFFQSLLPSYNPDAVADNNNARGQGRGAEGGYMPEHANIREGIDALMNSMRDLLANVQSLQPEEDNEELEEVD
ncbi:ribosome quality control complex subunit TCF25-like [Antedon mediterranea]|uniref:ribosome quality control complex subunit TCF25-like n=1 Tax=Antedon mediterranea TaxID=105859 RepID=UPI003AF4DD34